MNEMSLLLHDGSINGSLVDLLIIDGYIAEVGPFIDAPKAEHRDLGGRLVLPGFIESHIHLDKAFVADRAPGLSNQGPSPQVLVAQLKREFTAADVYARARRAAAQAIRHGCVAMRAYVEIDEFIELRGVEAMLELKADLDGVLDLQLVAFAQEGIYQDNVTQDLLVEGLHQGLEVLGGCPYMDPGRERDHIDWCFETATRYGVPLDFHADTADDPRRLTSDYIVAQIKTYGMQGRVQIGHLCTLDVLLPAARCELIEAMRDAQVHAVSLPATESHVKGRDDPLRTWRGVTRIAELREGGVNVAVATNNVVNPFTPFGHADPLRQLLITAMLAHLGNLEDLAWLPELVTDNPARALQRPDYGLTPGCRADLVVLDAPDPVTAIVEQSEKTLVFNAGRVVAENRRENLLTLTDEQKIYE